MKRFLKRLIIGTLAVLGGGYLFLYIWFHNSTNRVLSEAQQNWLLTEISESPTLPDTVYKTMEKYNPGFYAENTWGYKLRSLLGNSTNGCRCNEIYLPNLSAETSRNPLLHKDIVVKLFIEKHFSQKDCFTYYMNTASFGRFEGIKEASLHYFKKDLDDLSEREIVGLYITLEAPTYYNPLRNRERLDRRVDNFMNRKDK